jgi:hypothetical protein
MKKECHWNLNKKTFTCEIDCGNHVDFKSTLKIVDKVRNDFKFDMVKTNPAWLFHTRIFKVKLHRSSAVLNVLQFEE